MGTKFGDPAGSACQIQQVCITLAKNIRKTLLLIYLFPNKKWKRVRFDSLTSYQFSEALLSKLVPFFVLIEISSPLRLFSGRNQLEIPIGIPNESLMELENKPKFSESYFSTAAAEASLFNISPVPYHSIRIPPTSRNQPHRHSCPRTMLSLNAIQILLRSKKLNITRPSLVQDRIIEDE
ncbi:uncharacterized protein BDR25DRAFT_361525 [Lindgomyces ingoldianus]|uniref:Uncharacterized protein n=1 Tax=Lindgomyces ingoldianus TaxID=673940 RepID=A0ACB6QBP2_9PLEO|nr:uncharacterized protein BDR25DRAFT_361525 [Lindgomyces ingoldianus]KAF2464459.1 hypothetical protein BDR25DRAFT_361525 [Lindgomyces ingoldianus]